jgi:hypothetical protein
MYPVVHEDYRRSLIRRFPYAVFCEQSETTVTIYAVFHTSRDPDKWRDRDITGAWRKCQASSALCNPGTLELETEMRRLR